MTLIYTFLGMFLVFCFVMIIVITDVIMDRNILKKQQFYAACNMQRIVVKMKFGKYILRPTSSVRRRYR